MPHLKAFGMRNLQYEIETCHKIHNKGTMSQRPIQVSIFLSGTDVICKLSKHFIIIPTLQNEFWYFC